MTLIQLRQPLTEVEKATLLDEIHLLGNEQSNKVRRLLFQLDELNTLARETVKAPGSITNEA